MKVVQPLHIISTHISSWPSDPSVQFLSLTPFLAAKDCELTLTILSQHHAATTHTTARKQQTIRTTSRQEKESQFILLTHVFDLSIKWRMKRGSLHLNSKKITAGPVKLTGNAFSTLWDALVPYSFFPFDFESMHRRRAQQKLSRQKRKRLKWHSQVSSFTFTEEKHSLHLISIFFSLSPTDTWQKRCNVKTCESEWMSRRETGIRHEVHSGYMHTYAIPLVNFSLRLTIKASSGPLKIRSLYPIWCSDQEDGKANAKSEKSSSSISRTRLSIPFLVLVSFDALSLSLVQTRLLYRTYTVLSPSSLLILSHKPNPPWWWWGKRMPGFKGKRAHHMKLMEKLCTGFKGPEEERRICVHESRDWQRLCSHCVIRTKSYLGEKIPDCITDRMKRRGSESEEIQKSHTHTAD